MGRAKTVEINGRKYDAATGKLVNKPSPTNSSSRGGSIDGFSKAKPAQRLHSRATKSKTLDRKAVSKSRSQVVAKPAAPTPPKAVHRHNQSQSPAHVVNPHRQKRASSVSKSSLISKFGHSQSRTEVKAKPAIAAQHNTAPMPAQAQPIPAGAYSGSSYSANDSTKDKQKVKKKKSPRSFSVRKLSAPKARSVFAGAALFVLVAGYVTYLNIPNLSLRIAASRAGIDATLPAYRPSGFAMSGPINYSQGLVTINFSSNSDDRSFSIAERASSWDSESLLANYVENETPNYVTFQDKGLTVYVYEGSNATWVDGGIWYTIEGESQLNSDQLLRIASSM